VGRWALSGTDLEGAARHCVSQAPSKEKYVKDMKQIVTLALAGLAAGVSGCAGSSPTAEAPAAEPTAEKHGCKTDAEGKHVCGAAMKDGEESRTAPAPAGAPAEESKPAP
jgi:hypothetical protein